MRTTLTTSDALYVQAKLQAAREGASVGAVFEAALQAYLNRASQLASSELPPLPVHGGVCCAQVLILMTCRHSARCSMRACRWSSCAERDGVR